MATRQDVLRELGLTPHWRLRAMPSRAVPVASVEAFLAPPESGKPIVETMPGAPLATAVATPQGEVALPDDRNARIAALDWSAFASDVDACIECGLCKTRKKSVPGVGDAHAEWMFVGEAPGAEEDARGEPFVGQAGRLLDSMLQALGMTRAKSVYIANVLKCRPPQNRAPEPVEVTACKPYLDRQVALIQPKIIVALGKSAAATLLNVDTSIASMRGRLHRYQDVPLIVTYHPAYLLRNLPDKAKAWEDLCLARATLRK